MGLLIRPVREEDAAAIVAVLNPIIEADAYTVMDEPVTVEDQLAFIRGFPSRGAYFVAVDHVRGEIVGLQDVQPFLFGVRAFEHVGAISTFVSLARRRGGVGRSLCAASFESAREIGFLKLTATIRADNPEAIAFYRSQGFDVIGTARRHVRIGDRYIDEVLAERFLD